MKTIIIRIKCGRKYSYISRGVAIVRYESYRDTEEFPLVTRIAAKDQWFRRMTARLTRLLTAGRRYRGDVLAV